MKVLAILVFVTAVSVENLVFLFKQTKIGIPVAKVKLYSTDSKSIKKATFALM